MLFAVFGLAALVAIGGRYGRRQAGIERKYQARERVTQAEVEQNSVQESRGYSDPDATLIPLWPLAIVLIVVALVASYMLWKRGLSHPPEP